MYWWFHKVKNLSTSSATGYYVSPLQVQLLCYGVIGLLIAASASS